ncbi:cytochrome P450 [Mycolicibacterium parafortuitum]|uniref:Cytochrome P450 n=1 Tax=Mycolicibacterium parafortuitum TaxID=39692 RepID=A0A7I7UAI9_MYCPF|nr:cytochrome P450 [Mycolicibacterium parafortuitum]BBY78150.1 cytochrome P450 [Mycolicibacterium parafortuitum]
MTTLRTGAMPEVSSLPPAPLNPLPRREQIRALRQFHTGCETLRDAGGPVTRLQLAPRWLMPPVVVATSPGAVHDVLCRHGTLVDKTVVHAEMRHLMGRNLFDLQHDDWTPRRRALQPVFTKRRVEEFSGHMAAAAQSVADSWADGAEIDLDTQSRRLTLCALGRAVLGIDLTEQVSSIGAPMHIALSHIADRTGSPVKAPRWFPTPARRRAGAAAAELHSIADGIVRACRADAGRDAPLVRAMMAAVDPQTGAPLTDREIADDLIAFLIAGHDTTATTLAYALWQLGRRPDLQDRVLAEVVAVGERESLGPADVPALGYTVAVLHEALRLCPPAPATSREAVCDIDVGGHLVEAGSMLVVGIYALHRDPRLWADPLTFDPDRFTGGERPDRWQYLPFGAGPRSCIGDHFAMLEATLALATIVRKVEIVSTTAEFPVQVPFTAVAAAPITARVRHR